MNTSLQDSATENSRNYLKQFCTNALPLILKLFCIFQGTELASLSESILKRLTMKEIKERSSLFLAKGQWRGM
jgi:hypothetical protein